MDTITIFLAIALIIIAVAFLLTWLFRKSIHRDKKLEKLHERHDASDFDLRTQDKLEG